MATISYKAKKSFQHGTEYYQEGKQYTAIPDEVKDKFSVVDHDKERAKKPKSE